MNTETSLLDRITELKNEFYYTSGKNIIFKSKQKQECASMVTNEIGIERMLTNTVYIIPNTNRVFFDYTVFKLYANPSNYDTIIKRTTKLFDACIEKYGTFESHMNLKTFSVSAFERYKSIILTFCNTYLKNNPKYLENLAFFYIYNTPNMIDMAIAVVRPFVNVETFEKVVFIQKQNSEKLIGELLQGL